MSINFFTATFPYLNIEPFIENEIPVISKNVDAINIFPHKTGDELNHRLIPSNCIVFKRNEANLFLSFWDYLILIRLIVNEFFLTSKKYFFLNIRKKTGITRWRRLRISQIRLRPESSG